MAKGDRLSTGEIDRLGQRMAARASAGVFDSEDLALFRRVLMEWSEVADDWHQAIIRLLPGLPVTRREKSPLTTAQKLVREKTTLSRVWDLAGLRIVVDGGRRHQDEVVQTIQRAYPDASVRDRRSASSHGYRAVHVLLRQGRVTCEVQVRTRLQDDWAQMMERVADTWGRQIRYGGAPDLPDLRIMGLSRGEVVQMLFDLADAIDANEAVDLAIGELVQALRAYPLVRRLPHRLRLARTRLRHAQHRLRLERVIRSVRRAVIISTEL